jgi:phosphotransferase system HPr (HPr) family protein
MSDQTCLARLTIVNPQGLHMRPAYLFAELAAKYQSKVEVIKEHLRIDGKSVLSVLTLGASQGTAIEIEATGPDASAAVAALTELVSSGFAGLESSPAETEALTSPAEAANDPQH